MIDTHAHIIGEYYDDIDGLISDCKKNGICYVINCADNIDSSEEILGLKRKYSNFFFCALGIHPEFACSNNSDNLKKLEILISNSNVTAIGEIGLDFHYNDNYDEQIELFETQLHMAEKYNLPVIVHTRDAIQQTYDILKKYKLKGVIHCYSGSIEMAKEFIKLGYALGIGGVLTFKNTKLVDTVKELSLDNIVLETDSPFLSPEPFRGKKNNPSNVVYVAKKVCEVKKISYDNLVDTITKNVCKIFDITL